MCDVKVTGAGGVTTGISLLHVCLFTKRLLAASAVFLVSWKGNLLMREKSFYYLVSF